ncbi:hypothetical protein [Arthrobacter mobilis]|uniref:Uncharacterized protein n=1 Tax=Arthrobacter mobilis TaxID=2724944 RepID=A0A7X6HAE0_9MICC|nr:hypothetical protein [Arthrobacter mobilis]NKX53401.1 hypothetical protein [Arthrobacter mobilis]
MADQTVAAEGGASTAVVGPFTLRDVVVAVSVALLFLASVLPTAVVEGVGLNQWNSASLFHLGLSILLPAAVLVLFVIRRVAPKTKLRIGSLSVDQFASVTASFATAFYFLIMVNAFSIGAVVGFLGSLGLLTATVFAPWIPQLAPDFAGRHEIPAHPVARDAVPARPKTVRPAAAGTRAGEEVSESGSYASAAQYAAPAAAAPAGAAVPQPAGPEMKEARTGAGPAAAGVKAAASAAPASTVASGSASAAGTRAPAAAKKAGAAAKKPSVRTAPAVDAVAPGAADGEAMGIPDTEYTLAAAAVAAELKAGSQAGGPDQARTAAGAGQQGTGQPGAGKAGQPQAPVQAAVQAAGAQPAAAASGQVAGEADRQVAAKERASSGREPAAVKERVSQSGREPAAASAGAAPAAARAAGANGAATVALDTVSAARAAREEPISATRDNVPQDEETVYEAFWFAVGRTRPVYDENTGAAIFTLEPGAWILALQDRGDEFLVQHTDGRVGVLRDLTNIERA